MEEGQNIYFLATSFLGHGFSVGVSQFCLGSLSPAMLFLWVPVTAPFNYSFRSS